eukprot:jgi/Hompol1/6667/HPOL_005050-RA
MIKYPNKAASRPEPRLIRLESMPLRILWESKKKDHSAGMHFAIDFHSILEIRMGQNTKAFEIHGKHPDLEERAFSIIYLMQGKYKSLNLVAATPEDCVMWVTGLHALMTQVDSPNDDAPIYQTDMAQWLRKLWHEADSANTGSLDIDQVTSLMKRLNFRLSKSEIKSTFRASDRKKVSVTFSAFENFYNLLRFRPDIASIFSQTTMQHPSHITFTEFQNFLTNTQKVDWSPSRCEETYAKFTSKETGQMSMDHFSAFLISARNSIVKKSHLSVFQDMSQPLCRYFINTSHNTYLLGDQIAGESSVEGYIRALQKGCRCVELDCWDGPSGQPVIYHGHTLTTKIMFKDAILAIAKYAFVASPYPLILSLEMHCCAEQQTVIAATIREAFGDALVVSPIGSGSVLPSPQELLHRVLGKTGRSAVTEEPAEDDSDEDVSEGGNVKFDCMYSFNERKAAMVMTKYRPQLLEINTTRLTRVYPSIIRVTSSNLDPIPHWQCGTQMVALNFQTFDKPMELNQALFDVNGRCGYVLRPLTLFETDPIPMSLVIK